MLNFLIFKSSSIGVILESIFGSICGLALIVGAIILYCCFCKSKKKTNTFKNEAQAPKEAPPPVPGSPSPAPYVTIEPPLPYITRKSSIFQTLILKSTYTTASDDLCRPNNAPARDDTAQYG
ncbi:unnamed protein product [Moneuplotes crassus]|uniref:Uncharacterized protein n=1 Tax=Euplotes crassus TaxID=5936 RepID=A0AAD1X8C6_EUPCR|nr:unnamed protein product [Moneuplotes crassus]